MSEATVGALGESEVLRSILAELAQPRTALVGPGDDCAVLPAAGDIAVSTDSMVEGSDFRLDWHSDRDLGWKLAVTNLSDIVAMGATPTALTLAVVCPTDTPVSRLSAILRGMREACEELTDSCEVVGGDLTTGPVLIGVVTALGSLQGRKPILRSGARVGDRVAYAGELGLSGRGLALLYECAAGDYSHDPERFNQTRQKVAALRQRYPRELAAHLTPRPPLRVSTRGATAMMDVSDGLSLDAERLAKASGCCIDLGADLLTRSFPEAELEYILNGGEDHGLLATFPSDESLPEGFEEIGQVTDGSGVSLDGRTISAKGWDAFHTDRSFAG
jgi:thiamine-monophosphate kinase